MIEVKGTKAKVPEATGAERYTLKEPDGKSPLPIALGLLLTGLALYLKSFMPGWSKAEAETPASPDGVAGGSAEPRMAAVPVEPDEPAAEPQNAATFAERDSSGEPRAKAEPFSLIESPAFDFRPFEASNGRGIPHPLQPKGPANDNSGIGGGIGPVGFGASPPAGLAGSGSGTPGGGDETGGDTPPDGSGDPDDASPPGEDDDDGAPDDDDGAPDDDDRSPTGNRAPRVSGPVYLAEVVGCATLAISVADLLRNAQDPDGDTLSVTNLAVSSGTLTPTGDGWLFRGDPHRPGRVALTYQVTDGDLGVEQVAYVPVVEPPPLEGTGGDDMLLGSPCADDIDGRGGDDNIDGRGGDDVIAGGPGDDHIVAGDGDDVVFGGAGDDIIFGGAGNDHITGGAGNDRLFGDGGDDLVQGDSGDDALDGGAGHDLLWDGAGRDVVNGGTGDDRVIAALDADDDVYDGGAGRDTLDYSHATEALRLDLTDGIAIGTEIGEDRLAGFETVVGGAGDDHFVIGRAAVALVGGGGNNTFEFQAEFRTPAPALPASPVVHEILDFRAGDRIRVSKYDIFERAPDGPGDRFDTIYGDESDDDGMTIRYRHDRADALERTVIEADIDDDRTPETTIVLSGRHFLVIVEDA